MQQANFYGKIIFAESLTACVKVCYSLFTLTKSEAFSWKTKV